MLRVEPSWVKIIFILFCSSITRRFHLYTFNSLYPFLL